MTGAVCQQQERYQDLSHDVAVDLPNLKCQTWCFGTRRSMSGPGIYCPFCSVFSLRRGTSMRTLRSLSPMSCHRLSVGESQWEPGAQVLVKLSGQHIYVSNAEERFSWDSRCKIIDYDVTVTPDSPLGTTVLKYDVIVEGCVVVRLRHDLEIVKVQHSDVPSAAAGVAPRSAFASYSVEDRPVVSLIVGVLQDAAGIDVFLDVMSLRTSQRWQRKLEKEIRTREAFMLFWSRAASESQWVDWEWRTALREKGDEYMQIHPPRTRRIAAS